MTYSFWYAVHVYWNASFFKRFSSIIGYQKNEEWIIQKIFTDLKCPCKKKCANKEQWCKKPKTFEPGHEKMCLMPYANNKGTDQPAHPCSLISAFVVRCLDSIMSLNSIAQISRLLLAFVAAQAGLCLAWSETPVSWLIYNKRKLTNALMHAGPDELQTGFHNVTETMCVSTQWLDLNASTKASKCSATKRSRYHKKIEKFRHPKTCCK